MGIKFGLKKKINNKTNSTNSYVLLICFCFVQQIIFFCSKELVKLKRQEKMKKKHVSVLQMKKKTILRLILREKCLLNVHK